MLTDEVKSIDEYEVFLTETMASWEPRQQMALAAAIAERWLPAYESFSAEEEWGDSAALRRSLDAVWGHIGGRRLTAADVVRHTEMIHEITPHMDDFDAMEALTACVLLKDALRACGDPANALPFALGVALCAFEGFVEEWPVDPAAQLRVWNKSAIRKEYRAHLKLIERIGAFTSFDPAAIESFRKRNADLKIGAKSKPKPKASPGLTNRTAFEQYRRYVESDLKGRVRGEAEPEMGSYLFAITYLGHWMGRYSRRMQTLNGSYGRLADEIGMRAVVARNRACDAAETSIPEWGREVREMIEMCLKNNTSMKVLDAGTSDTPHPSGPSMRRLWLEARRRGDSAADAWKQISSWAIHRPAAWEAEDRLKKKGSAGTSPELGQFLARPTTWTSTGDPAFPWQTVVDGRTWRIRINDFPDEILYSLIFENESAGDFHDWPETWQRPETEK